MSHYPTKIEVFVLKSLRKVLQRRDPNYWYTEDYCDYVGQNANDHLRKTVQEAESGLCVVKFGSVELNTLVDINIYRRGIGLKDLWRYCRFEIDINHYRNQWCMRNNAGFFSNTEEQLQRWYDLVTEDMKDIDVLVSYQRIEKDFVKLRPEAKRIDLDGFYAPCLWQNPWTSALKDKRVLVIHPFIDSISQQYKKRELLWENPDVLPEFASLEFVRAVQTIGGASSEHKDWFAALDFMKNEIDRHDYDVAVIGCGAYGMNLAAHVKRQGKIAIHLAGWTQFLFGICGVRWINTPKYARFINEHWVRPSAAETPKNAKDVERGCYW